MAQPHYDVLVVGAGLSGIGVSRYIRKACPQKSLAILETKPRIGGTWDLFRYPGIRSDSDMHTMGYAFKPWTNAKAIADGGSILNYVRETAQENGLVEHIQFERKVISADYDSRSQRWTLQVDHNGQREVMTCGFLFSCAGYYRHDKGYLPEWDGYDDYKGTLVHPQFWPEDLDYAGKTVAIIGSGATAVTLTPAMAETAAHVYQVQRSPTYVMSRPAEDKFANTARKFLPERVAYAATRWRTILGGRKRRKAMAANLEGTRKLLIGGVAQGVGDGVDWKTHFVPRYMPGQQRICAVPDGDLFRVLRDKRATMVTGTINRFTETGIEMTDGTTIDADIIVTATGLVMQFLGGISVSVDGQDVDPAKLLIYKGFMYSNLPNLVYFTGYTNASWTLKVDLVAEFACRLLRFMDSKGHTQVVPVATDNDFSKISSALKFISGYVVRTAHLLPKHGASFPWVHEQDYMWDRKTLKRGRFDDGTLQFSNGQPVTFPPLQRKTSDDVEIAAE
ncbi:FAD-containing monooxygenase EthA (plasmid) [Pseudosulfitobacter pseudonitzschiae]|uniref:FAD-containing monooxygenase EthA n=1 Tax=Pseudosulfitobacter pseudonitzschiae TaxID=1402135 RepID=A0A221K7N6_9RHOB|nr:MULTISPECIES: NAD(P)/FAD-dependent oxidoreductase [Roseobacteraceae]ASM74989.1 FAD-containing monooxygenase EthA [Pseudosulfitobacter pseudonitzschiae]